jgi:hypothetical protein
MKAKPMLSSFVAGASGIDCAHASDLPGPGKTI